MSGVGAHSREDKQDAESGYMYDTVDTGLKSPETSSRFTLLGRHYPYCKAITKGFTLGAHEVNRWRYILLDSFPFKARFS